MWRRSCWWDTSNSTAIRAAARFVAAGQTNAARIVTCVLRSQAMSVLSALLGLTEQQQVAVGVGEDPNPIHKGRLALGAWGHSSVYKIAWNLSREWQSRGIHSSDQHCSARLTVSEWDLLVPQLNRALSGEAPLVGPAPAVPSPTVDEHGLPLPPPPDDPPTVRVPIAELAPASACRCAVAAADILCSSPRSRRRSRSQRRRQKRLHLRTPGRYSSHQKPRE